MDAIWLELYNAAKEVQNPRQISDYVLAEKLPLSCLTENAELHVVHAVNL